MGVFRVLGNELGVFTRAFVIAVEENDQTSRSLVLNSGVECDPSGWPSVGTVVHQLNRKGQLVDWLVKLTEGFQAILDNAGAFATDIIHRLHIHRSGHSRKFSSKWVKLLRSGVLSDKVSVGRGVGLLLTKGIDGFSTSRLPLIAPESSCNSGKPLSIRWWSSRLTVNSK